MSRSSIDLEADCGHQRDTTNRPNRSCWPSTHCASIWRRDRGCQDPWRCSSFLSFPRPQFYISLTKFVPGTDGREPKFTVCPLFRTDFLPAARVPPGAMVTAGIEDA
jgi:hypothetical protein